MAFTRTLTRQVTTATTVRTGTSASSDVVIGLRITNTTAAAIKASAYIESGGLTYYLIGGATNSTMGADIAVGGSMIVINGDIDKVVMTTADVIKVVASGAVDVICSALEN
jgi:hypothetical protein